MRIWGRHREGRNQVIHPTAEQVARVAYQLWERRGRTHGHHEEDWFAAEARLLFPLNYELIANYPLRRAVPVLVGETEARKCRFCERTPQYAAFGPPRPVLPATMGVSTLLSCEICDECEAHCRGPLSDHLARYWGVAAERYPGSEGREPHAGAGMSLTAYKALVAMALLIMPRCELEFFSDALDWVDNPAVNADASLFAAADNRIYRLDFPLERPGVSLARRRDDTGEMPYMLFFLAWDRMIVQLALPLCLRDSELEGGSARLIEIPPGFMS
jgi:Protein of unknown function (DUF2934)